MNIDECRYVSRYPAGTLGGDTKFKLIDKILWFIMTDTSDKIYRATLVKVDGTKLETCSAYFENRLNNYDKIKYHVWRYPLGRIDRRLDNIKIIGTDLQYIRRVSLEIGSNTVSEGLLDDTGVVTILSPIIDAIPLSILYFHEAYLIIEHTLDDRNPNVQIEFSKIINPKDYNQYSTSCYAWYFYHDNGIYELKLGYGMAGLNYSGTYYPYVFFKGDTVIPEQFSLDQLVRWLNKYSIVIPYDAANPNIKPPNSLCIPSTVLNVMYTMPQSLKFKHNDR
jgi:hypothetical protein